MSLETMKQVVKLERSHLTQATEVLAQAFNQDPIMQYFYPVEEQSRLDSLRWLSRLTVSYCQIYNQIYTTTDAVKGVAVWLPPGTYPMNTLRLLLLGFYMIPFKIQWQKLGEFFSLFAATEKYHHQDMARPHWYLMMLGVAPTYQGSGVGSSLIQPVLEQADREGVPCYLETSTEGGVRFYQRQGFEVVRSEQQAEGSPRFWTMRRDSV